MGISCFCTVSVVHVKVKTVTSGCLTQYLEYVKKESSFSYSFYTDMTLAHHVARDRSYRKTAISYRKTVEKDTAFLLDILKILSFHRVLPR